MRARTLFGAAAFALVLAGPLAGAAGAQEPTEEELTEEAEHLAEENGAEHADVECIPILLEGGTVEDCQASPNPLLPETNEIIWGSIGFIIVFGFLRWKAYPAMKQAMDARTERIRADLEGAESAKADAQRVLDEYRAQLADAKAEASRIIEEARQQADVLKREREAALQNELSSLRERAAADVESARSQALADLRNDVAALISEGVDRVVRGGLDAATQQRLVEEYITSLAARSN